MNICHIITRLIIGGAQENTLLTCRGLHERGHAISLIVGPDAGPEGSLLKEASAQGYTMHVAQHLRRAIRPAEDLQGRRELRQLIEQIQPDVVHTHSSKAGILGRLAARDAQVPLVLHTVHGTSFNRTQRRVVSGMYQLLERWCAGFTDHFIAVADAMTRQMLAAGIGRPEQYTTVYSGMNTEWFDPSRYDRSTVRKAWGFGDDVVVAGSVARLFRHKGYEQLIPAMAEAARACPELRFVWVGDGAQRAEYEERLQALGLRDRVHLTGLMPPQRVGEMLAGMDFVVHASQWEGLPRAVVQALLMERPAVSFDIDGAPEVVIPGRTGLLVPLNDTKLLAEAIITLARDREMRVQYGQAGRALCVEQFDWRKMVEQIEQLCETLLTSKRKAREGHSRAR